jgi:group I intron endonuclease
MNSGIYRIRNTVTGEEYIGSSTNLERRRGSHFCLLRAGTHKNTRLQKSFRKHGEQSFLFAVLETCAPDQLEDRERHWVKQDKPSFNSPGKTFRNTVGKYPATITFACHPDMVAEVDAYVTSKRLSSRGHAMRRLLLIGLEVADK